MSPAVVQLRIDIGGTKPVNWRRIRVRDDMTLTSLVNYLSIIFGSDCGVNRCKNFIMTNPKHNLMLPRRVSLRYLRLYPGQKLVWQDDNSNLSFTAKVEAIRMFEAGVSYPICLGGSQKKFNNSVTAINHSTN